MNLNRVVAIFLLINFSILLISCNNPPEGIYVSGNKATFVQIYIGKEMQDIDEYDLNVKWLKENDFIFDSVSTYKLDDESDSIIAEMNLTNIEYHYTKKK